jgi:hypothetical protein
VVAPRAGARRRALCLPSSRRRRARWLAAQAC